MANLHDGRRPTMVALATFLVLAAPGAASAQTPLGVPNVVFPADFGTIQTVRELPDGRVLVADPLGKALYAVDLDAGARVVVGSEGQGPQEYLQPDAVWPLPGDSTLLVDLGNGRLVVLGPDLTFGPTMPIAMGEPRPGSAFVLAIPQGVDQKGDLYARAMGGMGGSLPDSAAVLRIDRGTSAVDTIGSFKLEDRTQSTSGGANNRNVRIEAVPLSPQDAWGVAPDGTVVLARSGDYSVEWISPDGRSTRGSANPFRAVGIGTAEKEEWVREQGRSGGGIGISMMVNNGAVQMNFSRGGMGGAREIDQYDWPSDKPPFYSERIVIDNDGQAWVHRHVDAGELSTYDVFDRSGAHVGTYTLESGKRVISFGANSVYVVSFDEFDLNYLERYSAP